MKKLLVSLSLLSSVLSGSVFAAEAQSKTFLLKCKNGTTHQVSEKFIQSAGVYRKMGMDLGGLDPEEILPFTFKDQLCEAPLFDHVEKIIRVENREDLRSLIDQQEDLVTLLKTMELVDALEIKNPEVVSAGDHELSDLVADLCADNIYNSLGRSRLSVLNLERSHFLSFPMKKKLFDGLFKRIQYEGQSIPLRKAVSIIEPYDSDALLVGSVDGYVSVINSQGVIKFRSSSPFGTPVLESVTSPNSLFAAFRASRSSRVGLLQKDPFELVMIDLQDEEEEQDYIPSSLAFSDDGSRLFVGDDQGYINVFDTASKKFLGRLKAGVSLVQKIVVTEDNKLFCAGENENKKQLVQVVDLTQERSKRIFKTVVEQDATTSSFLVTQNGGSVLTEGNYGNIKLFDIAEKKEEKHTLWQGGGTLLSPLFKDKVGNEYVVIGSKIPGSSPKAYLYETTTQKEKMTYQIPFMTSDNFINSAHISPDTQLVALCISDKSVELFDREIGFLVGSFPTKENIVQQRFLLDGSLVTLSEEGKVVLWKSGKRYIKSQSKTDDDTVYDLSLFDFMMLIFSVKLQAKGQSAV